MKTGPGADGLNEFVNNGKLKVNTRTSSFAFRGKEHDVANRRNLPEQSRLVTRQSTTANTADRTRKQRSHMVKIAIFSILPVADGGRRHVLDRRPQPFARAAVQVSGDSRRLPVRRPDGYSPFPGPWREAVCPDPFDRSSSQFQ